jgi:two-component system cell cycle sensor histidine kinase/response regulator CckA
MSGDAPEPRDATTHPTLCDASERAGLDRPRAGIVVHDLNNMLMTITATVAEALARPDLDGVSRAEFSEIGDAARRGAALTRQLLDGAARAAPALLGPALLGIDAALREMAPSLRRALGDVSLRLTLEQPEAAVRIDPAHLHRVLTNLALNARNAMPSGGALSVSSDTGTVTQAVSQFGDAVVPGCYVTIVVRDTGTGIPAVVMPRLFEPFFTTRAGSGGTGLGLASVRELVREAGGFLSVDSEVGRGTTMCVHLPRHEAAPGDGTQPVRIDDGSRTVSSRRGTVLLVDDEPVLLRLAERALSRAGWGVLAADSATTALDAARDADPPPCMVVSDMTLPDRDGLALVGEVRALIPALPAILTSGYAGEALRVRAAAAGIALLVKPFAMSELLDTVAEALPSGR